MRTLSTDFDVSSSKYYICYINDNNTLSELNSEKLCLSSFEASERRFYLVGDFTKELVIQVEAFIEGSNRNGYNIEVKVNDANTYSKGVSSTYLEGTSSLVYENAIPIDILLKSFSTSETNASVNLKIKITDIIKNLIIPPVQISCVGASNTTDFISSTSVFDLYVNNLSEPIYRDTTMEYILANLHTDYPDLHVDVYIEETLWVISPTVVVTDGVAKYIGATNKHTSYADINLTEGLIASFKDTDMQQWQAVKDAVGQLIGAVDWVLDPANNQIKWKERGTIAGQYIFLCTESINGCPANSSIINPKPFDPTASFQWRDVCASQASAMGGTVHSNSASGTCIVTVGGINKFYGIDSRRIEGEEGQEKTLPLTIVAAQVISNAQSLEQAISLLAETYIEAVANSIFDLDILKQFVAPQLIIDQFEINKTLI